MKCFHDIHYTDKCVPYVTTTALQPVLL